MLLITRPEELALFHQIFCDGTQWGINIHYAVQKAPRGLGEALIIGGHFIGNDPLAFILGDNIFYGEGLGPMLRTAAQGHVGANVFAYYVDDPRRYDVVELTADGKPVRSSRKSNLRLAASSRSPR